MTLKVTVKAEGPYRAEVHTVDFPYDNKGPGKPQHVKTLESGESVEVYITSTRNLVINELPALPAAS